MITKNSALFNKNAFYQKHFVDTTRIFFSVQYLFAETEETKITTKEIEIMQETDNEI